MSQPPSKAWASIGPLVVVKEIETGGDAGLTSTLGGGNGDGADGGGGGTRASKGDDASDGGVVFLIGCAG